MAFLLRTRRVGPAAAALVTILVAVSGLGAVPAPAAPGEVTVFTTTSPVDNAIDLVLGDDGNLWFTNGSVTGDRPLGRMTPSGNVTSITPDGVTFARAITSGADGNIWFSGFDSTDSGLVPLLGRLDPDTEVVTIFTTGVTALPVVLTPGPDGDVWFADQEGGLGTVASDGTVTRFDLRTTPDLDEPLTFDGDGNLWTTAWPVPASTPGRLVRTTPAGVQTTFAVGRQQPVSVEVGADGNLWFADTRAIGRMTPAGVVSWFPNDFVTEVRDLTLGGDGNIWFAANGASRIGRVTPAGVISLFRHASAATARDLLLGADGNIWYGDGDVVGRVRPTGVIRTFGGSGVESVTGLTPGPGTDLWFASSASGLASITMAGDITAHEGGVHIVWPDEVSAGDGGGLWFSAQRDSVSRHDIGFMATDGQAVGFGGEPACRTASPCYHHWGGRQLTEDPDGNLWFLDTENQIGRVTPNGQVSAWTRPGAEFSALAVGADGNIWITGRDRGPSVGRVYRLRTDTGGLRAFAVPGTFRTNAVVTGADGNVWFGAGSDRLGRITPAGGVTTFGAASVTGVADMAAGPDGNVWFSSQGRVGRITPAGRIRTFAHPGLLRATELTAGPDGNVWFLTLANPRVGRVTPTGSITFSSGGLSFDGAPTMVAGPDDDLWFTSTGNDRLARVTTAGVLTTTDPGTAVRGGLALGPAGHLWFSTAGGLGRLELAP
jgi:streptogramin lyase